MSDESKKQAEFEIVGFQGKSDISVFISQASAAARVQSVKVKKPSRDGSCRVIVGFDNDACTNDFRQLLMGAQILTIQTPDQTFDVIHLQVKKSNPFE